MTTTEQPVYSQRDEQRHILAALGDTTGRLLEIGSYHPTVFSNSRALIERGWGAVMIEPSPECFLTLLKEYGKNERIDLICAAVGIERGLARLYATADAVSTTDRAQYERWKTAGGFYGSFHTPVITIADILNQFGAFDFVSIDTEGTSKELFRVLLQTGMLPRCICVEYDQHLNECLGIGLSAGYKLIYQSGENLVFSR
jgi:FkbM family methyltransferase